jgi:hypothetical protein
MWHTIPWHAFIYQAGAGASTVYVKATVAAFTNQTILDPPTSSTLSCKHRYKISTL